MDNQKHLNDEATVPNKKYHVFNAGVCGTEADEWYGYLKSLSYRYKPHYVFVIFFKRDGTSFPSSLRAYEAIIKDIENICTELNAADPDFTAEIKPSRTVEALQGNADDPFVQTVCSTTAIAKTSTVGYTTDAPFMTPLGAPSVIFGPGKSSVCHKPDEYIEIADMEKGRQYYRNIITELLT